MRGEFNAAPLDPYKVAGAQGGFEHEILTVRDMLKPIRDGTIERGHCPAGQPAAYGGRPGDRKTTLKDARRIAYHAIAAIDQAVERFHRLMEDTEIR